MQKRKLSSHLFAIWFFRAIIVSLIIFSPRSLYADGKYFPEKAYKIPPAIPSQRAILVYKDGIEKLTIESALDGQGQEFGWIIPLPSKPMEFEKASPGLMKTLSLTTQPKITHDLTSEVHVLSVVTTITALWTLLVSLRKPKRPIVGLLLIFLITLLFASILMPALSKTGVTQGIKHGDILGVRVEDIQEIGSYELAVLEADNAEALDKWLRSNGFTGLTEMDKGIISDYIKDSWCFVVAKLRREGSGYSRPHPLAMAFASEMPVYPMRLTATVGSDVYLELFVIADKKATCGRLTLELCDKYAFKKRAGHSFPSGEFLPGFIGKTYQQGIGHPETQKAMWDGCVLSRLCGTLAPSEIEEDIVLELRTDEPSQKHYYSRRGARGTGLVLCLSTWCILVIVLTGIFYTTIESKNGRKFYLVRIIIPAALLSLLLWGVTYAALPKVEVKALGGKRLPRLIYDYLENQNRLQEKLAMAVEYSYFKDMQIHEVIGIVDDHFRSKASKNAYTGERIKHEDSPGNYTVFQDERGIVLRNYSIQGYPHDFVLTSRPEK
ncbi:MAG: DUF2330 domain-containing protein [Planctomycetota bacterium]|jgi:hypothetical protein